MLKIFLGIALFAAQFTSLNAHADEYNDRAQQALQEQRAQEDAQAKKEWEATRNKNNVNLVRRALKIAGPHSRIQCYHSNGFNRFVDQNVDADYNWVPAKIGGAKILIAYEAVKIDGDNCLTALFGIACPYVIAKQIEASEQPLPEPYLEVCHVNSREKSCRVSNDGVECH